MLGLGLGLGLGQQCDLEDLVMDVVCHFGKVGGNYFILSKLKARK
jgi:hypothetical protein